MEDVLRGGGDDGAAEPGVEAGQVGAGEDLLAGLGGHRDAPPLEYGQDRSGFTTRFTTRFLPNLRYAEADAHELREVLLDPLIGTFEPEDVFLFAGEQGTWSDIRIRLRELAIQSQPSDVLLVYFAGHALVPEWSFRPDAYLVTADLDAEALKREPDRGLRMAPAEPECPGADRRPCER